MLLPRLSGIDTGLRSHFICPGLPLERAYETLGDTSIRPGGVGAPMLGRGGRGVEDQLDGRDEIEPLTPNGDTTKFLMGSSRAGRDLFTGAIFGWDAAVVFTSASASE